MMYDSSPPSIKAKTQNSPVIKKARTISRVVLAFSCGFSEWNNEVQGRNN